MCLIFPMKIIAIRSILPPPGSYNNDNTPGRRIGVVTTKRVIITGGEMRLPPPIHQLGLKWRCLSLFFFFLHLTLDLGLCGCVSHGTDKQQHLQTTPEALAELTKPAAWISPVFWKPVVFYHGILHVCCWPMLAVSRKISSFSVRG